MTHRVLFCTIGATPQVVTETVWALTRQVPPWTPDEVHVVTTAFKLSHIRQSLQARDCPLARLIRANPPPVTVHVPRQDGGTCEVRSDSPRETLPPDLLLDVNTEREAALMGNLIFRLIAGFTADTGTELHISLAGGRKTMSAHALMALSLVGRPRDRATHVLVGADYEDHPDFWHPDQGGLLSRKADRYKDPKPAPSLDPAKASVVLVPTPAPLMRHRMAREQQVVDFDLIESINRVNLAAALLEHPHVRLDTNTNSVHAGGVMVALGPKLFAVYRLLATARKEGWPGAGPDGIGPEHTGWLTFEIIATATTPNGIFVREQMTQYIGEAESVIGGDPADDKSVTKSWFTELREENSSDRITNVKANLNPNISNLEIAFRNQTGPDAAAILAPTRESTQRRGTRFGLNIPPHMIEIV